MYINNRRRKEAYETALRLSQIFVELFLAMTIFELFQFCIFYLAIYKLFNLYVKICFFFLDVYRLVLSNF